MGVDCAVTRLQQGGKSVSEEFVSTVIRHWHQVVEHDLPALHQIPISHAIKLSGPGNSLGPTSTTCSVAGLLLVDAFGRSQLLVGRQGEPELESA